MNEHDFLANLLDVGIYRAAALRIIDLTNKADFPDEERQHVWKTITCIRRMEGLRVMENMKEMIDDYKKQWRERFPA